MSTTGQGRRGRRPGAPDTKSAILDSARQSFAERGFGGTTIRAVATRAGVDAALVHHYFGSKDDLFLAALHVPLDPRVVLGKALAGERATAAERLLRTFLTIWDDPETQAPMIAVARGMLDPSGGRLASEGFIPVIVRPVVESLAVDRVDERVPLVVTQILGLIMVRYLLRVEPLASWSADQVVACFAPTLERHLSGPLDC